MFWDNWFGAPKEKRTQLHFFDDGSFEFRERLIEDSCFVTKQDGIVTKAWKHFYSNEIPFNGYKGIHADAVTMSFDRDFILDLFNKVPTSVDVSGKPKKNENDIKKWTAQVAESQRFKVMNKGGSSTILDKVTWFLGIGLLLMILAYGAMKAWG